MEDLITLVNELNNRGVSFHSLEENITMHKSKKMILIVAMGTIKKYLKPLKVILLLIRLEIVILLSLQN